MCLQKNVDLKQALKFMETLLRELSPISVRQPALCFF